MSYVATGHAPMPVTPDSAQWDTIPPFYSPVVQEVTEVSGFGPSSPDVTMSDGYAGGPVVDLSLDPHSVPPELKKEGQDWFAVFNPAAIKDGKKKLNVDLVHTLTHER